MGARNNLPEYELDTGALRRAYAAKGGTQMAQAAEMGIGFPHFSDMLRGKCKQPRLDDLVRLMAYYGQPLGYFVRKVGE